VELLRWSDAADFTWEEGLHTVGGGLLHPEGGVMGTSYPRKVARDGWGGLLGQRNLQRKESAARGGGRCLR